MPPSRVADSRAELLACATLDALRRGDLGAAKQAARALQNYIEVVDAARGGRARVVDLAVERARRTPGGKDR